MSKVPNRMIHNCLPLARQPVMTRKSATAMRCSMLAAACAVASEESTFVINPGQISTHFPRPRKIGVRFLELGANFEQISFLWCVNEAAHRQEKYHFQR